jgi:hypothetical protein
MATPATLPADFFANKQSNAQTAPDTLPADFFSKQQGATDAPKEEKPKDNALVRFAKSFDQTVAGTDNPSDILHGIGLALSHPHLLSDSLKEMAKGAIKSQQDAIDSAYDFQHRPGVLNKLEGFARGVDASIPLAGPAMLHAGDQAASGDLAGAGGTVTGIVAPAALGHPAVQSGLSDVASAVTKPVKAAATSASERMYQSALKPPPGSYTTQEVKSMVRTGLDNGIPVSPAGAEKLDALATQYSNAVKQKIANGASQGAYINKFAVTPRLNDTVRRFENQAAPTSDLEAISKVGEDFISTKPSKIPVQDAQAIKQGTYQQIKSRNFGDVKTATVEAEKSLARGIKEELETQFPEIKDLNASQGKLINLDEALQRAIRRTENKDIFSLGGKIATAGVGTIVGAATGSVAEAGAGTLSALVLHHIMSDPVIQSKLAIAIGKASGGKVGYAAARAKVAGYAGALGSAVATANAASAGDHNDPTQQ